MKSIRFFTVLFLLGVILTNVLSDSTQLTMDNNHLDLNNHNHAMLKRNIYRGNYRTTLNRCVRCKYSRIRCCLPYICVNRRFRTSKCLRMTR